MLYHQRIIFAWKLIFNFSYYASRWEEIWRLGQVSPEVPILRRKSVFIKIIYLLLFDGQVIGQLTQQYLAAQGKEGIYYYNFILFKAL